MAKYCIGIDVGGTSVKCGLFTTEGELEEKWSVATNTDNGGANILPDVARALDAKLAELGIDKADVAGAGLGVPGPVDADGVVPVAVNLHWGRKDVAGEFSELSGLTSAVGNDANVAALGEMWRGGGEGYRNVVMVTLGTGVGGGIIVDGKMIAGAHGAGGEIGHFNVNPHETIKCNCGNAGCLEQYTSATGIVRLANEELAASDDPSALRGEEVTSKNVWDAYKDGDALAARVVEKFARYLGRALGIIASTVDPDVFIIGGGVSNAGDPLIDAVTAVYREMAFSSCKDTPIVLAKIGNDAGIYGAAKLALDAAQA